ncbi:hypothetical protein DL93DRAFT_2152138 [Clavulina sp. PMI_390]|nr:hypothetical protein DL93DRAFT_2152138 [Clavulina sp. PMI_390]
MDAGKKGLRRRHLFDRFVATEMEAVGHVGKDFLPAFFRRADEYLDSEASDTRGFVQLTTLLEVRMLAPIVDVEFIEKWMDNVVTRSLLPPPILTLIHDRAREEELSRSHDIRSLLFPSLILVSTALIPDVDTSIILNQETLVLVCIKLPYFVGMNGLTLCCKALSWCKSTKWNERGDWGGDQRRHRGGV